MNHKVHKEIIAVSMFAVILFSSLFTCIIGSICGKVVVSILGMSIMCLCILSVPLRGLIKPFACLMGWHSYHYDVTEFDGASEHAKCQWCGYEGMIDSQGNLF